ncbi:hypothetical protein [Mesorhizobium sp.]|uniref:hypothetical protein n=1 Tax=Mesorhizobium sp. TaxID=1871066 RepID=UPI0025805224|nr:hypothetical protein [Mesorhizobium sp.]
MGSVFTCKLNPCCGDRRNCEPPRQYYDSERDAQTLKPCEKHSERYCNCEGFYPACREAPASTTADGLSASEQTAGSHASDKRFEPPTLSKRKTSEMKFFSAEENLIAAGFNCIAHASHRESRAAGWYKNADGTEKERNVPEMLALIHSEISEALEGFRKNLMDDKLPHRKMVEVELADAIIRIGDLAGFLRLDVGTAMLEKMEYNRSREDHKIEARGKQGGKAF